jgi:hypothetical protein
MKDNGFLMPSMVFSGAEKINLNKEWMEFQSVWLLVTVACWDDLGQRYERDSKAQFASCPN